MSHQASINRQARLLKRQIHKDAERNDETFRVGVEIEGCLINDKGSPVDAKPLIDELAGTKYDLDLEYAKCQFEYKTEPVSMDRIGDLNSQLEDFIEHLDRKLGKIYGPSVMPAFLGANPSPDILSDGWVADKPRYRRLARWQGKMQDVEIEGQHLRALHAAFAIQGFHFHLQGRDPTYTAMMFNHILNLIPSVILLGANSRLFAGRMFSTHEPRIYLYDQTEQQNSGFPAVPSYLRGTEDYIDYIVSRKPVVAKDYYGMVKERHDDARIRLKGGGYRVETRIMSVQPTPKSMMAMIEFFIGYLHRAIHEEKELRPLAALREERQSVVRSGFHAKTHFNVVDTARHHLAFAHRGLRDLGIKREFLDILDRRIDNRTTPGDHVAKLWQSKFDGSAKATVAEIVGHIWERTRSNTPIT